MDEFGKRDKIHPSTINKYCNSLSESVTVVPPHQCLKLCLVNNNCSRLSLTLSLRRDSCGWLRGFTKSSSEMNSMAQQAAGAKLERDGAPVCRYLVNRCML